jgi:hypothetical protein
VDKMENLKKERKGKNKIIISEIFIVFSIFLKISFVFAAAERPRPAFAPKFEEVGKVVNNYADGYYKIVEIGEKNTYC